MIHIIKKGTFELQYIKKCDSFFLCYEAKTTPTVKYRRWLNIDIPKMQQSTNVFHEQNPIFQILL